VTSTDEQTTPPGPTAAAAVTLDEAELRALREAGRQWAEYTPAMRGGASTIDPDLGLHEQAGSRPGDKRVRVRRSRRSGLETVDTGYLRTVAPRVSEPKRGVRRTLHRLRRTVLGAPLRTLDLHHERLTKIKALAVLSSDALSSVAYASDQIMVVLLLGLSGGYGYSLPIMGAIVLLLALVVLSYRQTIKAYPKGGGSYIVAKDNLGPTAGLIAGSALMTDYVLTVAVSISAGVAAITAAAPGISEFTVPLCVGFILLIVLGNLRGIRESGSIFAAPTYIFIISIVVMLGTIAVKLATGSLSHHTLTNADLDPEYAKLKQNVTIFLVLKAFSSGCSALTGVEAISDGVPAFKPPEWMNARRTLTVMALILGSMFVGITVGAYILGLAPDQADSNILINQLAEKAFGSTPFYFITIGSTTAILVLAANTSFSDFPRLFFFMARDDYAPHQFKRLGDRLAFSNGIVVLGTLATVLVVIFKGSVDSLIPLYAIGVFLAFTMSQAGMVARHLRLREPGWRPALVMNAMGMCATAIVLVITAYEKFTSGAWLIVLIIPCLVVVFKTVHSHYAEVTDLHATEIPTSPDEIEPVVIVPIADLNGPALQSLALARRMSDTVIAVHISDDPDAIARLRAKWKVWGDHVPLTIIDSQYRAIVRPLMQYIAEIDRQRPGDTVIIVLPELVATRWWHQILHNQTALRLKAALLFRPGTVVMSVPYHLRHQTRRRGGGKDKGLDFSEL
jgi:amino acid transporter